jgi:hypothetical protein
MHHKPH